MELRTASFVNQSARELIEELGERSFDELSLFSRDGSNERDPDYAALLGLRVVCIPAADEADELVAIMIAQLLRRLGCDVHSLTLADRANILEEMAPEALQFALVSALPPFATGQARSLCRLLRQHYPELKIILGVWNFKGGVAKAQNRVGVGSANVVATSLQQAVALLSQAKQAGRLINGSRGQSEAHEEIISTASSPVLDDSL